MAYIRGATTIFDNQTATVNRPLRSGIREDRTPSARIVVAPCAAGLRLREDSIMLRDSKPGDIYIEENEQVITFRLPRHLWPAADDTDARLDAKLTRIAAIASRKAGRGTGWPDCVEVDVVGGRRLARATFVTCTAVPVLSAGEAKMPKR